MAAVERTFVMVKPDAFGRGLVGEIVSRLERRGLTLRAMKLLRVTPEIAGEHYAEHREKPFYGELVDFITSGPAVAMVVEGLEAVSTVLAMMVATDPLESAEREIAIYFTPDELV